MRAWRVERFGFLKWWALRDITTTCSNPACPRRTIRLGPYWTRRGARRSIGKVYV